MLYVLCILDLICFSLPSFLRERQEHWFSALFSLYSRWRFKALLFSTFYLVQDIFFKFLLWFVLRLTDCIKLCCLITNYQGFKKHFFFILEFYTCIQSLCSHSLALPSVSTIPPPSFVLIRSMHTHTHTRAVFISNKEATQSKVMLLNEMNQAWDTDTQGLTHT